MEIRTILKQLAPPLRERAESVAVHFEWTPEPGYTATGIEPDTLGLFEGDDYITMEQPVAECPTRIILFLGNLWDFTNRNPTRFREEVRVNYFHELGHYLGLDEDDLDIRGLQ